ncbi:ABC transporter permease [Jannaschia aquimarina]|uniref:Branched-chain amino acid transport system / permease component n=1 Tax=Jannaschia aquimarina TaxID=935700 RepID=A0A0D1EAS4_9RHOB|nr:ABC transporter permease [Jannaschia aquimarina]KIT14804.1 Branched-chain amino acid transport system / permease component [Jannaschia aquimarina]SNS56489.1 nucleoside ABC transporter membrane protein [Jannaschia aquimarina]
MIRLERRAAPSRGWSAAAPVVAVILTLIAGGLMFAALGTDPVAALRAIFWDPVFGEFAWYFRGQLLVKAAPLVLIATGLALGFRAGVWNIGAEGQYIVGALAGAAAGLAFYSAETRLIFPFMVLCGLLGGLAWAMIPALLRVRFGANEILTSLMLVYVAENLLASAAVGWLRNPDAVGFPGSRNLSRWEASANPELIAGTGAHWGVLTAILIVVAAHVILTRHLAGFQIEVSGQAPRAARFAGVVPGRMVLMCFGIAGALAGMAGLFEVTGPAGQISIDFASGYGFTAIIVAFLGRLQPLGILVAGLLMALTYVGGDNAASNLGLPVAAISAFQGMLLFFLLAVDVLANFRVRVGRVAA